MILGVQSELTCIPDDLVAFLVASKAGVFGVSHAILEALLIIDYDPRLEPD